MKDDLSGIVIDTDTVWDIEGSYDLTGILRALPSLVPADWTLYFEGTVISDKVSALLERFSAEHKTDVYPGTVAPKPKRYHVAFRPELIESLIPLSESLAEPEVCDHFLVYRGERVLLSGYDFGSIPLVLSGAISEQAVQDFTSQIGCTYRLRTATEA